MAKLSAMAKKREKQQREEAAGGDAPPAKQRALAPQRGREGGREVGREGWRDGGREDGERKDAGRNGAPPQKKLRPSLRKLRICGAPPKEKRARADDADAALGGEGAAAKRPKHGAEARGAAAAEVVRRNAAGHARPRKPSREDKPDRRGGTGPQGRKDRKGKKGKPGPRPVASDEKAREGNNGKDFSKVAALVHLTRIKSLLV
jgi:hypothetical protein